MGPRRNIDMPFGVENWNCVATQSFMICLAVSTEYRRVTDGLTDILRRQSPRYAWHRAMMTAHP